MNEQNNISIAAEKRQARKEARLQRDALSDARRTQVSQAVCCELESVFNALPQEHPVVASYVPMGSEIDVRAFAAHVLSQGGRLALPLMLPNEMDGQRMQMRLVPAELLSSAPFVTAPFSAYEPISPELAPYPTIDSADIDMIVVPLLAFDTYGRRLGYGGGCYDRYLPACRQDCVILGVAATEQELTRVPTDKHDLVLPRIITA